MLNVGLRATLYEIFDPIILDIDRLIFDQISQVRLKRGRENHLKGQDIAVSKIVYQISQMF